MKLPSFALAPCLFMAPLVRATSVPLLLRLDAEFPKVAGAICDDRVLAREMHVFVGSGAV